MIWNKLGTKQVYCNKCNSLVEFNEFAEYKCGCEEEPCINDLYVVKRNGEQQPLKDFCDNVLELKTKMLSESVILSRIDDSLLERQ